MRNVNGVNELLCIDEKWFGMIDMSYVMCELLSSMFSNCVVIWYLILW